MSLAPEQTLLHYRLVEKIGEGGMGVVWKARDTTLGRDVAIKVLPAAFATEAERLGRFEREARTLASLNHPNIAGIYGLHQAEGLHFLAMEFVEGEDLSTRLARGPLALEEALRTARQIAEAFEEAHAHGVIHRDLKPANVKATPEGKVKVLDFGLAKALATEASADPDALSQSPTMTSGGTAAGVLLGTAAYMCPEQAHGRPVDRRADVWSFGCLLYEMLVGRKAFEGESVSDTLASVLRSEPDLDAVPPGTPQPTRRLLRRCLQKDPQRRLHDMADARIEIDDALERVGDAPASGAAAETGSRVGLPLLAGTVVVVGAALFAVGYTLAPRGETQESPLNPDVRVSKLTHGAGLEMEPSLSPDGNYLAYTTDDRGNLDIVVLPLAGGNVTRVTESEADDAQAVWSPDGSRLAFVSARDHPSGRLALLVNLGAVQPYAHGRQGDIFLVPAFGGAPVKLVENGCHPTWSPDGTEVAFQSDRANGQWDLWKVPAAGGEPIRLTDDVDVDYQPAWSNDGRWIAYVADRTGGSPRLRIVPAAGGEPRDLTLREDSAFSPTWSADGRSLWLTSYRTGTFNLWRLPFDPKTGEADRSRMQRITVGEASDVSTTLPRDPAVRRLAYSSLLFAPDIWEMDLADGRMRQLTSATSVEDYPDVSADGRSLLFTSTRESRNERLWSLSLDDRSLTRVSEDGRLGRWSPDGRSIAYTDVRSTRVLVQEVGSVTAREVVGAEWIEPGLASAPDWSPDGGALAFHAGSGNLYSIYVYELDSKQLRQLTPEADEAGSSFATWSPDGSRIVYQREEAGTRDLWIIPASGGTPRKITDGSHEFSHPRWSPVDPDLVLVLLDHKNVATVSVSSGRVRPLTAFDESTVVLDYPAWGAEGSRIYFSVTRKTGDIYLLEDY